MSRPDVETTPRCGAKKANKDNEFCTHPAGFGTDHVGIGKCKFHGGCTPTGRGAAAKAAVRMKVAFLGDLTAVEDLDPSDALLSVVRNTAAVVAWLQERLAAWDREDFEPETVQILNKDGDVTGTKLVDEFGLQRSAYLSVYGEERDRLARSAKMALDAGIAERQVRIAEQVGGAVVQVLRGVVADLGFDPEDAKVQQIVQGRLLQLVS